MVSHSSRSKLAELVLEMTGQDVAGCYQCGKCTAGCPMAKFMDLTPNQVMRLVQLGDEQATTRLLEAVGLWNCAGCLTCTQRCPKQLDPAAVMDALRELSHIGKRVNKKAKKVLAFHKAFLAVVRKHGRMNEIPLVQKYKLSTLDLFSDVMLAPVMFRKGKLPLKAHKVANRDEIKRIFDACQKKGHTE